jgi:hypothetical protein
MVETATRQYELAYLARRETNVQYHALQLASSDGATVTVNVYGAHAAGIILEYVSELTSRYGGFDDIQVHPGTQ